jgi:predicted HTH transcriptional regulator
MAESIGDILGLETQADGKLKVRSRERRDLEFKECCDENTRKICLKTIAAFANTGGGCIVFGVTDSPRFVCGVDPATFPDEAVFDDFVSKYLSPIPDFTVEEYEVAGYSLVVLEWLQCTSPQSSQLRSAKRREQKTRPSFSPASFTTDERENHSRRQVTNSA